MSFLLLQDKHKRWLYCKQLNFLNPVDITYEADHSDRAIRSRDCRFDSRSRCGQKSEFILYCPV